MLSRAVSRVLPLVPKPLVWSVAQRYIAGRTLGDAVATVRELNRERKIATVDVLGEELRHADETHAIAAEYGRALAAFDEHALDASVSVKLSALGLKLDLDLCREHLETIVRDAAARTRFVRIDMEALRDLEPNVRICKGIYVEPPAIAFRDFHDVRAAYLRALDALLAGASFTAIATHDELLLAEATRRVAGRDGYEFQMLLGVRPERGDALVAAGEPLRVYVPYGEQWYAYSLRRLQENPAIAGHVMRDTLRRLVRRRSVSR